MQSVGLCSVDESAADPVPPKNGVAWRFRLLLSLPAGPKKLASIRPRWSRKAVVMFH